MLAGRAFAADAPALQISRGPHLFIDDYLIAETHNLSRKIQPLQRLAQPVLDSERFGTTQPYVSVTRDPESQRFRLWYNRGPAIWHAESSDGIEWREPRVAWDLPRSYGCSLIDDRERESDPARRFKLANWQATRAVEDTPKDDAGMFVGFSPDGFAWTAHPGNPVLKTRPDGLGTISREGVGDIVDVFYDPLRRCYAAAVKVHALRDEGLAPGPKAGSFSRRLVGITHSRDFIQWEKPRRIFVPDERDDGLLEFYGMGGVHARGDLLIGLVRVLRDDLPHEPGGKPDGIGYTVLATSRDGVKWTRDREPFLDRNPQPGTWDRAMTWASAVEPVGGELFIYYGGYARGHKIAADKERQLGLARMPIDRYVSRAAGAAGGSLRTPLLVLDGAGMTINANVKGELRVRLLDESGTPIRGFDFSDCAPIQGDSPAHSIVWKGASTLPREPMRLELMLHDAELYGFAVTQAPTR